jgi:thiol-disulfide isomerase/thioredoxin
MKLLLLLLLSQLADSGVPGEVPDVQLLDFTASYCQPCRQMVPILQRMEQDQFPIRRVDITEEPDLSRKFRITGVPTLVVMVEGREVQRFVGLTSEKVLRDAMRDAARALQQRRGVDEPAELPKPPVSPAVSKVAEDRSDVAAGGSVPSGAAGAGQESSVRRSLADVFDRAFRPGKAAGQVIRGQSPGGDSAVDGLARAAASTVRVQVEGRSTKGGAAVREVGTGTIIHSVPAETLVLTCAHFFLDLQKTGSSVTVEVFEGGQPQAFAATVVGGNHTLDLAVIRIVPRRVLSATPIPASAPVLTVGQSLASFGCDLGKPPGRLDMELVAINRYLGPGNLVCSIDPVSGRSGGGLYSSSGELVGVCSCAEREKSEGLYMAWTAVASLLKELQLEHLLQGGGEVSGVGEGGVLSGSGDQPVVNPLQAANDGSAAGSDEPEGAVKSDEGGFDPLADMDPAIADATDDSVGGTVPPAAAGDGANQPEGGVQPAEVASVEGSDLQQGPEITVIIDEKTPGSQKRVIVIPRASAWLLEMLTGENSEDRVSAGSVRPTSARPSAGVRPVPRRNVEPVEAGVDSAEVVQAAYPSES